VARPALLLTRAKASRPCPKVRLSPGPPIRREHHVGMKIVVDFDLCESNAVCMGIAPEVFEVRDDDFLYILDENPPEELRPKLEDAVRSCPKAAISLQDD
jgi:ferredoxin